MSIPNPDVPQQESYGCKYSPAGYTKHAAKTLADNRTHAVAQLAGNGHLADNRPQKSLMPAAPVAQRLLRYNARTIHSIDELSFLDLHQLFNGSPDTWKKRLGSNARKPGLKEAWIAERIAELTRLVEDRDIEIKASTPDELKNLVLEKLRLRDRERSEAEAATRARARPAAAADTGEAEAAGAGAGPAPAEDVVERLRPYVAQGRVFTSKEFEDVSEKARLAGGHGFRFELELAEEAVRRNPEAKVQLGGLGKIAIEAYLEGPIAAYEKIKEGPIGSDIVIWTPRHGGVPGAVEHGGTFVQAKSIKFTSLHNEMKAAVNQLAGMNASGKGASALQRENSLRGPQHTGAIYIEIYDGIGDIRTVNKEAQAALHSPYVHHIDIHDVMTGIHYIYPQAGSSAAASSASGSGPAAVEEEHGSGDGHGTTKEAASAGSSGSEEEDMGKGKE